LIRAAPITWIDETNAGDAFYRDSKRAAPHNLYGVTDKLWARSGQPVPPRPLFAYLPKGQTFAGEAIDQFHVGLSPGYDPAYTSDPAPHPWTRALAKTPFVDTSGTQVAPTNVIVQFINYPAASEGEVIGEGDAWVFSDHGLVKGRWTKPNAATPTSYVDGAG